MAINFLAGNVLVALSIYRLFEPPLFMSDAGIIWVYDKAAFQQHDRYENPHYYTDTWRDSLDSLLLIKRRAIKTNMPAFTKNSIEVRERRGQ